MLTTGIQNLPEPLARAQAAYHDGTARLAPVSPDRLARRVEHFASSVQFVLDDPDAARHLHDLTRDLRTVPQLGILLPQVLQGAMAFVGGDFGNIQIVDPATGSLRLVTQAGFGPEFLDYFAVVDDGIHSAGGRPGRARRRPSPTSAPTRASRRTGRSPPLRDSARSSPRPWSTTPVT